jgi:hypothetical protein
MNLRVSLIAYHSNAHNTWDQNLTWLQLAFNMTEHESTKAAPFVVVFPFQLGSTLLNLWKINDLLPDKCNKRVLKQKWTAVKQNLCKSQVNIANRYNRNHVPQPFKEGDLVYYRNDPVSHAGRQITAKLTHRYEGRFKVDKFITPITARLVDPTTGNFVTTVHVSLLKPGPSVQDSGICFMPYGKGQLFTACEYCMLCFFDWYARLWCNLNCVYVYALC